MRPDDLCAGQYVQYGSGYIYVPARSSAKGRLSWPTQGCSGTEWPVTGSCNETAAASHMTISVSSTTAWSSLTVPMEKIVLWAEEDFSQAGDTRETVRPVSREEFDRVFEEAL